MQTHRGARYHGYELVQINSYTDFVELEFDKSATGLIV